MKCQSNIRNVFRRERLSVMCLEDTRGKHEEECCITCVSRSAFAPCPDKETREVHEVMNSKSQIRCFNIRVGVVTHHTVCSGITMIPVQRLL